MCHELVYGQNLPVDKIKSTEIPRLDPIDSDVSSPYQLKSFTAGPITTGIGPSTAGLTTLILTTTAATSADPTSASPSGESKTIPLSRVTRWYNRHNCQA